MKRKNTDLKFTILFNGNKRNLKNIFHSKSYKLIGNHNKSKLKKKFTGTKPKIFNLKTRFKNKNVLSQQSQGNTINKINKVDDTKSCLNSFSTENSITEHKFSGYNSKNNGFFGNFDESKITIIESSKLKFILKIEPNNIRHKYYLPIINQSYKVSIDKIPPDINSYTKIRIKNIPSIIYEGNYVIEILENMIETENRLSPDSFNLQYQSEINPKMRSILIDWIIDVHLKFHFLDETLFLAVNIIDRYLSKKNLSKELFQLLGVTSLFIACKYEESSRPEISDFAQISFGCFNSNDILKMELEIMKTIDYEISITSPHKLLEFLKEIFNLNIIEIRICSYLSEIFLLDYQSLGYSASTIIFACIKISKLIVSQENVEFDKILDYYSKKNHIEFCQNDILKFLENINKSNFLTSSKSKYSDVIIKILSN